MIDASRFEREGQRARLVAGEGGTLAVVRIRDCAEVGRIQLEDDGDVLTIRALCIEEADRGYGLGSEAARLLREAAEAGPWRRLRAWAPPDRGLAVYFWCRMGLRPCFGEGPDGGAWFERALRPLPAEVPEQV